MKTTSHVCRLLLLAVFALFSRASFAQSSNETFIRSYSSVGSITPAKDFFYFSMYDDVHGSELWRSDGTTTGTYRIKDINAGEASSSPENFMLVDGKLYFTAINGTHGLSLWVSDGTSENTIPLKAITTSDGYVSTRIDQVLSGTVLIRIETNDGTQVWKTNGTTNGTEVVQDFFVLDESTLTTSTEKDFALIDTMVANSNEEPSMRFYIASDDQHGEELWKKNNTGGASIFVKDIFVGEGSSHITDIVPVGDGIYFSAYDGTHGNELWRSDGTRNGTTMVKDIMRGTTSSLPRNLSVFNNAIYFSIVGNYGAEIWRTDGSESGTQRIFPMMNSKCNIVTPRTDAVNKNINQKFQCLPIDGADVYTWELSTSSDFKNVVDRESGRAMHVFAGLKYNTKYFVRVKTDMNLAFSEPICFTTVSADRYSYIISPENRSSAAHANVNVISNTVPGASSYTIELNTSATFAGEGIVQSGPRAIRFTGLLPSTTYFARVKTNLSMQWGATRSFTTMSRLTNCDECDEIKLISEEEAQYGVEIFPNPFHDRFSITVRGPEKEKVLVTLIDAGGKTVYETEASTNHADEINSDLLPGLYILHVRMLKMNKVIRVVRAE